MTPFIVLPHFGVGMKWAVKGLLVGNRDEKQTELNWDGGCDDVGLDWEIRDCEEGGEIMDSHMDAGYVF